MKSLYATPHAARLIFATLALVALLAAMSAAAAATPITSDQFAPGWQAHAQPLIPLGPARISARDKYRVPGILPRGDYVVVRRTGDKAELIGYRFSVTAANVDQFLFLWPGEGEVEALPVADVPMLNQRATPTYAH